MDKKESGKTAVQMATLEGIANNSAVIHSPDSEETVSVVFRVCIPKGKQSIGNVDAPAPVLEMALMLEMLKGVEEGTLVTVEKNGESAKFLNTPDGWLCVAKPTIGISVVF